MTRPIFIENFVPNGDMFTYEDYYSILHKELPWENRDAPRDECFLAYDTSLTYSYGRSETVRRTYHAKEMHYLIDHVRILIDTEFDTEFNVCMLNRYDNQRNHLGWHADDSPEQDPNHPIAVISFGVTRYIFIRENGFKGNVPDEDKFLLTPGSLFMMPPGFQETHQHKIPKHDAECGGRISLTFRKLDR